MLVKMMDGAYTKNHIIEEACYMYSERVITLKRKENFC
jgi:hypothetical protein